MKNSAAAKAMAAESDADEYTTVTVSSNPDMWTAKICRSGPESINRYGRKILCSKLIDVGSISHLLQILRPE
jgi:hypothetical protein